LLRALSLTAVLSTFWLLLSGRFEPLLLGFGVASALIAVVIALRMDVVDQEGHPIHLTPQFIVYWLWLAKEIVKANIDVARRIWHPALPISPVMRRLPLGKCTVLGKVIYANSITLTPGTVTTDVGDDVIEIHALTFEAADALSDGDMERRVRRLGA